MFKTKPCCSDKSNRFGAFLMGLILTTVMEHKKLNIGVRRDYFGKW